MAKHRRPRPVERTDIRSYQPRPASFAEDVVKTADSGEKVSVAVSVGQWLQEMGYTLSLPDGTRIESPGETNYGVVLPDGTHVANIFLDGDHCHLIAFGGIGAGVDHLSVWLCSHLGLPIEVSIGGKGTVPYGF